MQSLPGIIRYLRRFPFSLIFRTIALESRRFWLEPSCLG